VNHVTLIKKSVTLLKLQIITLQHYFHKINAMKKAGIFIILIGLGLTIITAFTFFTREKVVDLGDVVITRNKPHSLEWSPLIGVAVMGLGGLLFLVSPKK
jgi:hypothetical protein